MKTALVIGGGKQGSVIARDLISDGVSVTVADLVNPAIPNSNFISFNVFGINEVEAVKLFKQFDVIVSALPGHVSDKCTKIIAGAGVRCVDLSFTDTDPMINNTEAKESGSLIIPDCGLAPGLPNFIIGNALKRLKSFKNVIFYVGGIAQDKTKPYGYVTSWSVADLVTEYYCPARMII
ncbi:saccharopine dehydrogenase NADP-binding domain-containing protein, partial [Patescibacteria group bacterium]|nr:saccharopine dehydrogenase NADP-binding domain-containing protein [Patescibacteria group bacterium]